MTEELRKLAKAAASSMDDELWWDAATLESGSLIYSQDAAFIAAASPTAVIALLDERDEARAAVKRLAGALEPFSRYCEAREALVNPVVRRIVEGE
jgi:hypothetical protein